MYIDADTIIKAASIVTALGVLLGGLFGIWKAINAAKESDKKQTEQIKAIQTEQTLLCYAVLACLKGLKEQGCNGPVTEAIEKMDKHLNKKAHEQE